MASISLDTSTPFAMAPATPWPTRVRIRGRFGIGLVIGPFSIRSPHRIENAAQEVGQLNFCVTGVSTDMKYRLALSEIEVVQTVRHNALNDFGIRPGFRLYNVSELDAVEFRLKTDEIRRIGTCRWTQRGFAIANC